jgi:hypothetical protein
MIFAYTLRINADGNVLSQQQYDSKSLNQAMSCCADANGDVNCAVMWGT